ncbi:MAG: LUD domain-containing protein [Bacteroidota bacterium]
MSAKASILAAIRANKPGPRPLPELPTYTASPAENLEVFTEVIGGSKARVIRREELVAYVAEHFAGAQSIVSTVPEIAGNFTVAPGTEPLALAGVDLAILKGQFAVAENGAIWMTEDEAVVRVLPFITQHLIIVVEGSIVPTMHEAYPLAKVGETGFGVFIAGPSKTADIEQSLVIGAHGPRSLAVAL